MSLVYANSISNIGYAVHQQYNSHLHRVSRMLYLCSILMFANMLTSANGACPSSEEYISYSSHCFQFAPGSESVVTYQDANATCRERAGALMSIHSIVEENFLYNAVQHYEPASGSWWIGLHYDNVSDEWKWDTDDLTDQDTSYALAFYVNGADAFNETEMTDRDYATSFSNVGFDWVPLPKSRLFNFICKFPMSANTELSSSQTSAGLETSTEPRSTMVQVCPTDYSPFGNYCYQFKYGTVRPLRYEAAKDVCSNDGASLLSLQSNEEALFVDSKIRVYGAVRWWLALQYYTSKKSWAWDTPFEEDHDNLGYNLLNERARSITDNGSAAYFYLPANAWYASDFSMVSHVACKMPLLSGATAPLTVASTVITSAIRTNPTGTDPPVITAIETTAPLQEPSVCDETPCPDYTTCIPVNDTVYLCICNDEFMTGKHCEDLNAHAVCRRSPPCSGYPFMYCHNPVIDISECFCEEHIWFLRRMAYKVDQNCEMYYDADNNKQYDMRNSVLKYLAPLIGVYTGIVAVAATFLACLAVYGKKKIELLHWNLQHMEDIKPPSFLQWLRAEFVVKLNFRKKPIAVAFHPQTDEEYYSMRMTEWTFNSFKAHEPDRPDLLCVQKMAEK